MSDIIRPEALINLLDNNGLNSKQELLEEMKRVHKVEKHKNNYKN